MRRRIVCENGCPEGANGRHKFSCPLAAPSVRVELTEAEERAASAAAEGQGAEAEADTKEPPAG